MEQNDGTPKRWIAPLAASLGAVGALIALGGPMLILGSQPDGPGFSNWPLPGMVLLDWAVLGVLGFLSAYLGPKPLPGSWGKTAWLAAGGLMPLMVLGALSIGPLVLLSLVFLIASAVLVAISQRLKAFDAIGFFALGMIGNLAILIGLIGLGGNL